MATLEENKLVVVHPAEANRDRVREAVTGVMTTAVMGPESTP